MEWKMNYLGEAHSEENFQSIQSFFEPFYLEKKISSQLQNNLLQMTKKGGPAIVMGSR